MSFFLWIETGSGDAMLACYTALLQNSKTPKINEPDLTDFRSRFKNFDELFAQLEEKGEFVIFNDDHCLDAPRLHSAMRKAQASGGSDFEDDWLGPLFISSRYWINSKFESLHWVRNVLLDLIALEKSWHEFVLFRQDHLSFVEVVSFLEEYFTPDSQISHKYNKSKSLGDNIELEAAANHEAFKEVLKLFHKAVEEDRFQEQNNWLLKDQRAVGLKSIKNRIIGIIARSSRQNEELPTKPCILITSLREAKTINLDRKVLFCLGLTTKIVHDIKDHDTPELDLLDDHLRSREYDPNANIRWTLGRFIQGENHLILSCPRVEENSEALATTIFSDLSRWRDLGYLTLLTSPDVKFKSEREQIIDDHRFVPAPLKNRIEASINAMGSRDNPIMTPFDGHLGNVYEITKADPEHANEYSPTILEVLADCAHRHFFSKMIYLQEFPEVRDELPRHEVGTAVHECLELFWKPKAGWQGGAINAENFDRACEIMQRTALRVLEKSGVDWKRGPLRRFDRNRILLGLDDPSDSGPRGMLKAALAYHRDLPFLAGPAFRTEMKFGMGKALAVPLTEKVSVRGIIDRLDRHCDENGQAHFLIIDYKTGRGKTIQDVERGKSLQIAIYALVTRHLFSDMKIVGIRGGLLILNDPNRREEPGKALDHPIKGVYLEHITAIKSGRSWVCGDDHGELVEQNLRSIREKISKLDQQVRNGQLWQGVRPDACGYCDFRDICFHNESILEEKIENINAGVHCLEDLPVDSRQKTQQLKRSKKHKPLIKNDLRSIKLSREQESAADVSVSASVSAGAGSGKTFILKTRVARLIRIGVPVRSILAITFTEKAAGEIRQRIEQALGEALDEGIVDGHKLTESEKDLFIKARGELAFASISTIHSFCHKLISMDLLLSSISPSLRVVTGPELETIEREVMRLLFSHKSPVSKEIEGLLSDGLTSRSLRREIRQRLSHEAGVRNLLRAMNRSPGEWTELFPKLQDFLLEKRLTPLKHFIQEWVIDSGEWADSESGQSYLKAREGREEEFERLLLEVEDALTDLKKRSFIDACEGLLACLDRLQTKSSVAAFRKSKKKLPRNWWKELKDELETAKLKAPTRDFEKEYASVRLSLRFLEVVQKAQQCYQDKKRELGVLDFEDLIERAHQMLVGESLSSELERRRKTLIKRLRERFKHILVDEFQDTDQRQWDIIRALIQEDSEDSTVFIVGDAKQSIYSWRNGDNRVFERACQALKDDFNGQRLVLSDNYRSGYSIIEWVNTFFENVFKSEFNFSYGGDGSKHIDTAVLPQAMKSASSLPEGSVHVLWMPKGRETKSSNYKSETLDEFMSVAKLTQKILEGDERFIVPDHEGPTIGILCRTTRTLRDMGQALDRLAIPYSSSHRAGFFTQESVKIMETAVRALAFDQDDISLAGLLRGPIMAWTDRDLLEAKVALHDARRGRRWTEALRQGEWSDQRGLAFFELYSRWKKALELCSPSTLLRLIVSDSGLDVAYARTDRLASLRNIWRLIEMVEQVERGAGISNGVIHLLSWISNQRFTAPEGAALAPAADIPVALTTIHGSKGLEFPIVILPGLARRSLQDQDFTEVELPGEEGLYSLGLKVLSKKDGYRRVDTVLSSILKLRSHARSRSEEKRLFYVACTRAASHLILPVVATRKPMFDLEATESKVQRSLRFANSHRRLLLSGAGIDDPENPNELEFRSSSHSVFVPVINI